MSPFELVFDVCRLLSLFLWRVSPSKFGVYGVCRLTSLFSLRASPHKFVFIACVASQVCFHGVCRLTSLFSWRVSPHKFVFMACVAFNLVFIACVAVLQCDAPYRGHPTNIFTTKKLANQGTRIVLTDTPP